jgi:hypothetical protein
MEALVGYDHKGAFGPAMTLIQKSKYFNNDALSIVTNLLQDNFF